jgi:hypothetical protein
VSQRVEELEGSLKVPYVQAITVLLHSRKFTKRLKEIDQKMPKPLLWSRSFPHDHIFAEVVAFYYFVLMKDYSEEQDRDEAGGDGRAGDSYSRALRKSLVLANALVLKRSDDPLPEGSIVLRTGGYASIGDDEPDRSAAALFGFIMKLWRPEFDGNPALDESAPSVQLRNLIAAVPFDEIREICKGVYRVKEHLNTSPIDGR